MSMQQIMKWGNDFPRIGGRECLTLSHWGKPIKTVNYPFLVFFPNILFLLEFGLGSNCIGMERVWENNLNQEEYPFLKNVFLLHGKENTKKCMPIPSCIHVFIFHHILGRDKTYLIIHPSRSQFFFPQCACPVHHMALTKMFWSIF